MKRPILIIAIGYIIGIIWGLYFRISIVPFYFMTIFIYIIINKKYKKWKFKILSIKRYFKYMKIYLKFNIILIIIISSFISYTITKIQDNKYSNLYNNVYNLKITATVKSNKTEKEYSNQYKIKIQEGKYKNTYLYLNVKKNIELKYGDEIEVQGTYIEPQIKRNYKGFNYKNYLKTKKVYGTVKAEKIKKIKEAEKWKIDIILNDISIQIKEKIKQCYNKELQGIVLGVLLGDTSDIEDDVKDQFSKSNISHVLAVSGMHVSYIIFLILATTKKICNKKTSNVITSIILIFYMICTGMSLSVIRACTMGVLAILAFNFYRKSNTINNIAISALIILIDNPFNIYSISFLLTFGGTIGIILFNPIVEKALKNIKIKNRRWKYLYLKIQRKCEIIIKILSVSISSQVIIAPIIVSYFNNAGIAFLVTNLLLSAVIGFIVIIGFIQVIVSFISMKIGIAIAKIIEIPTYLLFQISKIGDKIPFGYQKMVTPDLYQIIIFYIFIFMVIWGYDLFTKKYLSQTQIRIKNIIYLIKYKTKPYRKIVVIMLILIIVFTNEININRGIDIHFIDVGQGDSTLIITQTNKKILIDCGGSKTYDVGKNTLLPYLLARKVDKLDLLIISHFDQDHVRWSIWNCSRHKNKENCDRKTI